MKSSFGDITIISVVTNGKSDLFQSELIFDPM